MAASLFWLFATIAVAAVSAGQHAVAFRPLRIYAQDADAAKEVRLPMYNVVYPLAA